MKFLSKWGWMGSLMKNKITIHSKENSCSHQWGPLSLDKIEYYVYKCFPPTLIYEIIDKYKHIDLENLCSHQ